MCRSRRANCFSRGRRCKTRDVRSERGERTFISTNNRNQPLVDDVASALKLGLVDVYADSADNMAACVPNPRRGGEELATGRRLRLTKQIVTREAVD
jgi:hypothetical protein